MTTNANPQAQPAADDSANAVTAGIAGLRSVLSSARIYFDRPILKQADSELEALLREREALAAMTTRALAAEAALAELLAVIEDYSLLSDFWGHAHGGTPKYERTTEALEVAESICFGTSILKDDEE